MDLLETLRAALAAAPSSPLLWTNKAGYTFITETSSRVGGNSPRGDKRMHLSGPVRDQEL